MSPATINPIPAAAAKIMSETGIEIFETGSGAFICGVPVVIGDIETTFYSDYPRHGVPGYPRVSLVHGKNGAARFAFRNGAEHSICDIDRHFFLPTSPLPTDTEIKIITTAADNYVVAANIIIGDMPMTFYSERPRQGKRGRAKISLVNEADVALQFKKKTTAEKYLVEIIDLLERMATDPNATEYGFGNGIQLRSRDEKPIYSKR